MSVAYNSAQKPHQYYKSLPSFEVVEDSDIVQRRSNMSKSSGNSLLTINRLCWTTVTISSLAVYGLKISSAFPALVSLFEGYGETIWICLVKMAVFITAVSIVAKLAMGSV